MHYPVQHGNENRIKNGKNLMVFLRYGVVIVIAIIFLINWFFYNSLHDRWINGNHPNHTAKEYFILGEMVYFYRMLIAKVFYIHGPALSPLNNLQFYLTEKGMSYIPQNDGEGAFWRFKHLYSYDILKSNYPDDGTPITVDAVSPAWVKLLDDIYNTMEALGTKQIADKDIDRERYKAIPFLAHYYSINKTYLVGNLPNPKRKIRYVNHRDLIDRHKRIVTWLTMCKTYWNNHPETLNVIRFKSPHIAMMYYDAIIDSSNYILHRELLDGTFRCDSFYTHLYVEKRKEFIDFIKTHSSFIPYRLVRYFNELTYETYDIKRLCNSLNKSCGIVPDARFPTKKWLQENPPREPWNYDELIERSLEKADRRRS